MCTSFPVLKHSAYYNLCFHHRNNEKNVVNWNFFQSGNNIWAGILCAANTLIDIVALSVSKIVAQVKKLSRSIITFPVKIPFNSQVTCLSLLIYKTCFLLILSQSHVSSWYSKFCQSRADHLPNLTLLILPQWEITLFIELIILPCIIPSIQGGPSTQLELPNDVFLLIHLNVGFFPRLPHLFVRFSWQ